MPLPFLDASDAQIFETFNGVILGWACLLFLPTWRHTKTVVLLLVFVYSLVYAGLFQTILAKDPSLFSLDTFGSLDSIVKLFAARETVLLGWVHYIGGDLLAGLFVVQDSQALGIPHLLIAPLLPILLMATPVALAIYLVMRAVRVMTMPSKSKTM